jgi:WD40 repeat protein
VVNSFPATEGGRINSVAYSPDGSVLDSSAEELGPKDISPVRLWEVDEGRNKYKEIKYWNFNSEDEESWRGGYKDGVQAVTSSPAGGPIIAAAGGYNNDVKVWDYRSKELLKVLSYGDTQVWNVALGPDGRTVAAGGDDGSVRLGRFQEIKDGEMPRRLYKHDNGVWGIAFSPVRTLLASGSVDKFSAGHDPARPP